LKKKEKKNNPATNYSHTTQIKTGLQEEGPDCICGQTLLQGISNDATLHSVTYRGTFNPNAINLSARRPQSMRRRQNCCARIIPMSSYTE